MKDQISKELLDTMNYSQMEWCLETILNNDVPSNIINKNKTVRKYFTMLVQYNLIYLSESTGRFLLTNYGESILYWIKANIDS
jgi:hypothetical protein